MIPRTLAIVGGAGFLGRTLLAHIANSPTLGAMAVRCVDKQPLPADSPRPADFAEFVGDAGDPALLGEALEGADALWSRAAILGGNASADTGRMSDYFELSAGLTGRILAACDRSGCRRIFFDSSEQVFGDSADLEAQTPMAEPMAGNYYGAGKLIAEKLLRMWAGENPAQRSVQILRYSRVRSGQSQDVIRAMLAAALSGSPIRIIGNSAHRVAFVHVDDVMAANLAALVRQPSYAIHHVSADRPLSLMELAQRVREAAHAETGSWSKIVSAPGSADFEPLVVGMEWESSRRDLGLPPPKSLDEMLAETIALLRAGRH